MIVPVPPETGLNPRLTTWKANRTLFRVHNSAYEANAFNPGFGPGRFHPISTPRGKPIPTLYASNQINGVLAETVFHDRIAGDVVFHSELVGMLLSRLRQKKDLVLIDLTGLHLKRLGVTRAQLLESDEAQYEATARWAEALHRAAPKAQGMIWVSRQFDTAKSILLFGDRARSSALENLNNTEALDAGPGLQRVQKVASLADITVVEG